MASHPRRARRVRVHGNGTLLSRARVRLRLRRCLPRVWCVCGVRCRMQQLAKEKPPPHKPKWPTGGTAGTGEPAHRYIDVRYRLRSYHYAMLLCYRWQDPVRAGVRDLVASAAMPGSAMAQGVRTPVELSRRLRGGGVHACARRPPPAACRLRRSNRSSARCPLPDGVSTAVLRSDSEDPSMCAAAIVYGVAFRGRGA